MNDYLSALIKKIFDVNEKYYRIVGFAGYQVLNPPCLDADVDKIEIDFGVHLPDDYKLFLLSHDGWKGFGGQLDLLSTAQMSDPTVQKGFAELRHTARDAGEVAAAEGFIILGAPTASEMVFIDFKGAVTGAMPEFVHWDQRDIERFPSFVSYLERCKDYKEELVELTKRRLR
jgi:hypothetical protein